MILREELRDALAIPQITLRETEISRPQGVRGVVQDLSSGYIPPPGLEKLDQMSRD